MYNSFKDTIAEAYQQVELFNEIASNLDNVTIDSLDNQLSFVFEELVETIDALESKDDKEYIDGLADIFVTVAGLLQKSEKAGYNVSDAIRLVNINNLSKFIPYHPYNSAKAAPTFVAQGTLFEYKFEQQPPNTEIEVSSHHSVIVFKDVDGKVKKPLNFVPVDLSGTYPDFLKGEV